MAEQTLQQLIDAREACRIAGATGCTVAQVATVIALERDGDLEAVRFEGGRLEVDIIDAHGFVWHDVQVRGDGALDYGMRPSDQAKRDCGHGAIDANARCINCGAWCG